MTTDLFTYRSKAHAHRRGTDTEKEAARRAAPLAKGQAARVLIRLRQMREGSAYDLEPRLDGMDIYAVRRRLTDLKQAGHIVPTGDTATTPSGRRETIYRPTKP